MVKIYKNSAMKDAIFYYAMGDSSKNNTPIRILRGIQCILHIFSYGHCMSKGFILHKCKKHN